MYYTPTVLRLAGVTSNRTALLLSMGPAAVNAMGTIVGMILIDRVGRRWGSFHDINKCQHCKKMSHDQ